MLTKNDVASRLAEVTDLSKKQSLDVVEKLLNIIEDAVINSDGIKITGFATLTTKTVKPKSVVNPITKQPMMTKESKSLYIKTGSILKSKLNK